MSTFGESEQVLTRYLLNELSEQERERVEERMFTDRDFFEQVETAEMRLVDRYVLGEMAADERRRFRSQYLPVPEHARKVREAEQFHEQLKIFGSQYRPDSGADGPDEDPPFAWAARFGTPAFIAISLLALGAFAGTGAWLLTRQRGDFAINGNANQMPSVRAEPSPPQTPPLVPPPPVPTAELSAARVLKRTTRPTPSPRTLAVPKGWFTRRHDTVAKVSRIESP
jgi:hypothetical protein